MKKMWKRFVSLLLACTLLAGMLPLSASAAEKPEKGSEQYKYAESILNKLNESITNEQEKYGLYGPALLADSELYTYSLQRSIYDEDSGKWTTDTQYILVPGVDAQNTTTPNYNGLNSGQPWAESNPSAIYIAEGVTGIGNYAFASQPSLNNVVFQDASDLTYIGQRAFYDDDNAVFTDEGNEGENATLDLSSVTTMGEYAFYNCDKLTGVELGDMTAIEGNEEIPNKIPNNAFNNSGLQTVTIPDGIQHIGDGAFGHTSLSKVEDLVLPDGLKTIGDNAFVVTMGSGETGIGITSLTIPSSVESIGENAFSGRRNLQTVTVKDDGKEGAQLTLGDGAFGTNEFTAYSTTGSFTDDQGTTYEGLMGTVFHLPDDLVEKFINGKNCYTGSIEPMRFLRTVEPTCEEQGYHLYETRKEGAEDAEGNPVVLYYRQWIDALGHDYQFSKKIPATCETDSYDLYVCSHDSSHTENRNVGNESRPKDHNYQLTDVKNLNMGDSSATTFTWECQTQEHDDDRDTRKKKVEISINPTAVQADTTMTYGELVMPTVEGGKLTLAEDVDEDAPLTTDVTSVKVVFTPDLVTYAGYTGMGAVSGFSGVELTLKVDVNKAELDFSDVNFGNTRVFVDSTASEGTPITVYRGSLPEDVTDRTPLYSNDTGYNKNTPPPRNSTWSGTVSVTFTYDSDKYEVDTEKKPGANYTFDTSKEGQVTITHPYVIVEQSMNDLAAAPIRSLTYKANTPQDTVHLSGVPYSSTVSWKWEEVGNPSNSGDGTETSPSDENAMDIAPITDAGTYRVTITVEKDGFTSKTLAPITVTIAKAPVMTPTAVPDLQYKGVEQRGLQEPAPDALYTYVGGSQLTGTNAGPYTATAQLKDSENYRWSTGDDNGDGTVEISWNIAKRRVIETSINSAYKDQTTPFTGTPITAVSRPSTTPSGFFDVEYDDEGNLVGKIKGTETVAFKISHAQETNAETYTVIASIEDFANFCWQNHPKDKDVSLGTWTIGKLQINAPTINAESTTYTGEAYAGQVTLEHSKASDSRGSSQDIIDLDDTNIRYYTQRTGGNGGDAPVNAGTYFAGVESDGWEFVEGKVSTNYQIIGGSRAQFSISKATATMTFGNPTETKTYTAEGTALQEVTVTGLLGRDKGQEETVKEEVQYSYKYSQTPVEDWSAVSESTSISDSKNQKFTKVGYYQITAKWGTGTVSNNYTAKDASYTLTITQANEQKITLTSADANEGTWEATEKTYTTIYGSEKTFTVTGTAELDKPVISYAVKKDSEKGPDGNTADVLDVDSGSGMVTIHKAGTATITVTAAATANVGAASVEYTVTVEKATPTVNTNLTDDELTVAYTGEAITGYNKATPTADVVEEAAKPTGDITYTFYTDLGCSDENKVTNGGGKDGNIPIAVGTYYMKATYPGDTNYESAESKVVTVIVTEAQLTVDAKGYADTYDGDEHDPASITVTGVGGVISSGYTISYAKKTDGQTDAPDADSNEWKPDTQVKDVADSGDYWFKVVINEGDSYAPYIGSVTVDIDPKPLTVTKTVKPTKEYDGTVDATKNVKFTHIDTDIEGETVTAMVTQAEYNSPNVSDAEYITITYHLTAVEYTTKLENYTLEEGGDPISGDSTTEIEDGDDVAITPKPIDVAITNKEKVYDGKAAAVTSEKGTDWTVNESDLCELKPGTKDNLGITLSIASDSDAKDAGDYAITGKADNDNYKVTFTGNWQGEEDDPNNNNAGTYTITHRPIDVKIGNAEGFYGDAPDLTLGTKVILTPETAQGEEAGLVNGENIYGALEGLSLGSNATVSSSVGENYTIYPLNDEEPVLDDNGTFGNYNVTFTNEGTYTVKQRPITITIADHSSVYGDEIDDGIAKPVSGTDYQVSLTEPAYTGSGESAIVNNDALTVTLTTTASATAAAGTYDITGSAEGNKVNNYAITWAGNGSAIPEKSGQNYGKYTIDKAGLKVEFDHHDKVSNGVSINITDSYNANPLVLKNASTDAEVSEADKSTLGITYSIAEAGENGGSTNVATINETTGEVTIHSTGTVRVTVTVKPQDNSNYTGQVTTWYELNIIGGGQMALTVTPKTNLAYTGDPQALLESASCSLEGATIKYSLNNQDWKDTIPTGINAGNYTVYVKATDPSGQYSDVTEHVTVTIDKADLKGSFAHDSYPHVLATDGNSYNSAVKNPLTITSENYTEDTDAYIYRSDNMDVAIAVNGGSTIRVLGSAGDTADITVTVPEDNNYNGKTFTYTLEISDELSAIEYSVGNQEVTYNGQPQTIEVKVTAPASGATVRYWNEETKAYDLSEPPAYTNVQEGGYPIKFQITVPGYETVIDEATLTIEPKDIKECQVEGIAASYTFVNKPIEPQTVEVVDGSVILKEDTDYTITYGANTEVGEDKGSVIIKGTGNYTGSVTKEFEITPVDASDLTASLNRTFGYYRNSENNNATVTVTHGSHEVTSDGSNTVSIAVKDNTGADVTNQSDVVSINDQTVTFNQVGTYTIEVEVTGNHATNAPIQLTYALLPVEEGELVLKADNETSIVATYGEPVNGDITVTDANGTSMTENIDYSLTYTYTPFEGNGTNGTYTSSVMEDTPAAGMYVVTATGQGGYVNSVGTFTFLILQQDLAKATLAVNDTDLVFNHDEKRPSVTVTVDGNAQPTKDTDYTITYYNNVNASNAAKAVVTATGNNFTGSNTENFSIAPKKITAEMVKEIPEQYYTGSAVIPPVTITDGEYTLILGYDYTTACDAIGPGTATVTIEGKGNYTSEVEKTFTITSGGAPAPTNQFDLTVTPNQWTWEDDLTGLDLSVTFGEGTTLTLGTNYTLNVKGGGVDQNFTGGADEGSPVDFIKSLKPGTYTITATGTNAYKDSKDTETVTVKKIQPELTVTAAPETLSGGGKVTLTLKGEKLPAFAEGQDLSSLLTASAKDEKNAPDLSELEWETDEQTGVMTAELTLPNTSETYTFTLTFTGNEYYEAATASEQVVVAQQIISGGGGGPVEDQPANPDDTGVSDWLNTKEHLAYLAGYPGGTFGPDQNMTRAEAAQMFYNLLLEKDVEITVEFEDVPADAWYAKPVNTLASLGILSGVGNGRFDPERSITRAEFTVIAMKFANTSGGGVNIFSDVNEDDWFYSAVVDSTQYGWINGYPDGTFRPEATISRAEVTVIVNHMLGRAADRPYVIAHEKELNTFGDVNRGHWGYFHIAEATNAHEYHTEDGTESWTGLS